MTADEKYRDIVALGTKVYMSPYKEEHVGVVDTTTDTFSTIANTSLAGVTGTNLYWGAAAVGTKIYFAPWQASSVGVLDTANNTFSTIDISAAGLTGGTNQYTSARWPSERMCSLRPTQKTTWAWSTRPPTRSRPSTSPPA